MITTGYAEFFMSYFVMNIYRKQAQKKNVSERFEINTVLLVSTSCFVLCSLKHDFFFPFVRAFVYFLVCQFVPSLNLSVKNALPSETFWFIGEMFLCRLACT